jgi:hypothetical protein
MLKPPEQHVEAVRTDVLIELPLLQCLYCILACADGTTTIIGAIWRVSLKSRDCCFGTKALALQSPYSATIGRPLHVTMQRSLCCKLVLLLYYTVSLSNLTIHVQDCGYVCWMDSLDVEAA